jgi:hypothetical protein
MNSGEKSRFMYQLIYDPNFTIRELSAGFDVQSQPVEEIRVKKTAEVMTKLNHFCPTQNGEGYLSPSALNSYLDCSLQFYFNYVAGIKEPDKMQDEVDPALFGTLLHEAVRNIYSSLDNPVSEKDLDGILKAPELINSSIDKAFSDVYLRDKDGSPQGRNRVICEIIFTYIEKILQKDKEFCPIHIESLENSFFMEIPVISEGNELTVKIGGKIDRIDRLENSYRVLDYKTGSGKMSIKSIEELFEPGNKNRNRAAFQTFLYAKLFSSEARPGNLPVTPGVYLIREIFGKGFNYHFSIGSSRSGTPLRDYSSIDQAFSEQLNRLIYSIFDPDTGFTQTEEVEICSNCLYREICRR